jgi:hypothetical protein
MSNGQGGNDYPKSPERIGFDGWMLLLTACRQEIALGAIAAERRSRPRKEC